MVESLYISATQHLEEPIAEYNISNKYQTTVTLASGDSDRWRCCIKRGLEGKLCIKSEKSLKEMPQKYEIRNWSEYNAGLKQRGSLTFWMSEEVIKGWLN